MPLCFRAQHTCRQSASRLEGTRCARGVPGLTLRTDEAQGSHNESNLGTPWMPSLPPGSHCVPPIGAKGVKPLSQACGKREQGWCGVRAGQEPLMGRGPMRKDGAECSSRPAIQRSHDPQTRFPQRAWKSRAGMWGESAWRTIANRRTWSGNSASFGVVPD
jgi:hypothetical protein